MSLQRFIAPLAFVFLLTVAGMWIGATWNIPQISVASAMLFAVSVIAVAMRTNMSPESVAANDGPAAEQDADALRRNTRLAVLIYAWAGASLFVVYAFSGLRWQHGLQYAAATTLIAAILFALVHYAKPGSALRSPKAVRYSKLLTIVHGLAAAGALVFLLSSGKLWAGKTDWAANHVFAAGLVSLVVLCTLATVSDRRRSRS